MNKHSDGMVTRITTKPAGSLRFWAFTITICLIIVGAVAGASLQPHHIDEVNGYPLATLGWPLPGFTYVSCMPDDYFAYTRVPFLSGIAGWHPFSLAGDVTLLLISILTV